MIVITSLLLKIHLEHICDIQKRLQSQTCVKILILNNFREAKRYRSPLRSISFNQHEQRRQMTAHVHSHAWSICLYFNLSTPAHKKDNNYSDMFVIWVTYSNMKKRLQRAPNSESPTFCAFSCAPSKHSCALQKSHVHLVYNNWSPWLLPLLRIRTKINTHKRKKKKETDERSELEIQKAKKRDIFVYIFQLTFFFFSSSLKIPDGGLLWKINQNVIFKLSVWNSSVKC